MEIEELKSAWQNCEKKFTQSLAYSEKAIKTAIRQKSSGQIASLLKFQFIEMAAALAFIIVLTPATIHSSDDLILFISGCFICAIMVIDIVSTIVIISKLNKIDFGRDAVLKTSQKITNLKMIIIKGNQFLLFTAPVLVISFLPIGFKALHGIHIADHILRAVMAAVIGILLSYIAIFIIYKKFYLKQIKELESDINELNQFEVEG